MEYARAATTAMSKRKSAPRAALEAVAAAPQPFCPASARVVLSAAANHIAVRPVQWRNVFDVTPVLLARAEMLSACLMFASEYSGNFRRCWCGSQTVGA